MFFLVACAEWPRYSHLPEDTGTGRAPGGAGVAAFDWTTADKHDELADNSATTADVEPLGRGEGLLAKRTFVGTGWDAHPPEREACDDGSLSAFPVYETGAYAGDVDWWLLDIAEAGVLCSTLWGASDALRTDVLLFRPGGGCGLPIEGPAVDTDGTVLGYAAEGPETSWAVEVEAGIVALVAAPYAPDTTDSEPYRWGVALLEPNDPPDPTRCPSVARP